MLFAVLVVAYVAWPKADVYDTQEEACEAYTAVAEGEDAAVARSTSTGEREALAAELLHRPGVRLTAASQCDGVPVIIVGVSRLRWPLPPEVDDVPLVVFLQPPIEAL